MIDPSSNFFCNHRYAFNFSNAKSCLKNYHMIFFYSESVGSHVFSIIASFVLISSGNNLA